MRKNYRYYRRDEAGRLHEAEWFHSESDEDAIAHVQSKHPDEQLEVWHDQRPVPTLATYATSSLVAGSERTLAEARRILRKQRVLLTPFAATAVKTAPAKKRLKPTLYQLQPNLRFGWKADAWS